MKKSIFFIAIILISLGLKAQDKAPEIQWVSFEKALKLQKKNPKKIFMDVYTNWCSQCKKMDKTTFKNTDLINYINDNFYAVKFNGEGPGKIKYDNQVFKNPRYDPKKKFGKNSDHQLLDYLGVQGFPSIFVFEEDAGLLTALPGYRSVKQLEFYLTLFNTNNYKNIKTEDAFEKYKSDFVYEFGE